MPRKTTKTTKTTKRTRKSDPVAAALIANIEGMTKRARRLTKRRKPGRPRGSKNRKAALGIPLTDMLSTDAEKSNIAELEQRAIAGDDVARKSLIRTPLLPVEHDILAAWTREQSLDETEAKRKLQIHRMGIELRQFMLREPQHQARIRQAESRAVDAVTTMPKSFPLYAISGDDLVLIAVAETKGAALAFKHASPHANMLVVGQPVRFLAAGEAHIVTE